MTPLILITVLLTAGFSFAIGFGVWTISTKPEHRTLADFRGLALVSLGFIVWFSVAAGLIASAQP